MRKLALIILAMAAGAALGWLAYEFMHPTCSDTRFTGHRMWDLGVECTR